MLFFIGKVQPVVGRYWYPKYWFGTEFFLSDLVSVQFHSQDLDFFSLKKTFRNLSKKWTGSVTLFTTLSTNTIFKFILHFTITTNSLYYPLVFVVIYYKLCLSSSVATERLLDVMSGRYASRRHELFMNKKEREQCSGLRTSNLHQLSNPGFLGGGGEKDSAVLRQLMEFFKVLIFHCLG
jgi:hypothetical protein